MLHNPHPPQCFWHKAAQNFGAPDIKYCENTICSFFSEPANTWSNLGFIIVGLLIIFYRQNKQPYELILYGPSVLILGIVSFIYHMSNFNSVEKIKTIGSTYMAATAVQKSKHKRKVRT